MGIQYDFTFVENAIDFLKTGDETFLSIIAASDAAAHIYNHARQFNYPVPTGLTLELVTHLITPISKHKEKLPQVTRNLNYIKNHMDNISENIALQFLPKGFAFSGTIFYTFGYDIGVGFGANCSLNVAHAIFSDNPNELKYWAIHEMHHTGFITLKDGQMLSLENITTRADMAHFIAYATHLEGMATYAPLAIRKQEHAMDTHHDYIALNDSLRMPDLVKEYFDIYHYFADAPDEALVQTDWHKINILSDEKRLWYIVGAHMAQTIDERLGRDALTALIREPSVAYINTYRRLP